jgi:hypothetical protein
VPTIVGKYVKTFAEASHALPEGMHMNADYPFMLPPIVALNDEFVNLRGSGVCAASPIYKRGDQEFCVVNQRSSFEKLFHRKPQRFEFFPFKDENTESIGEQIAREKCEAQP